MVKELIRVWGIKLNCFSGYTKAYRENFLCSQIGHIFFHRRDCFHHSHIFGKTEELRLKSLKQKCLKLDRIWYVCYFFFSCAHLSGSHSVPLITSTSLYFLLSFSITLKVQLPAETINMTSHDFSVNEAHFWGPRVQSI